MADNQKFAHSVAEKVWYGQSFLRYPLMPLSWVFAAAAAARRALYQKGILKSEKLPIPVIVVGNINVGGVGKTPVTIWLANILESVGQKPAVISRGYGGKKHAQSVLVTRESDPSEVGDEPVLIAQRCDCTVIVDQNRIRAANTALSTGANVIISDDGLQHYRLQRDIELVVMDASRGLGNGLLLPAGPLRESEKRLQFVDRVLLQQEPGLKKIRYGNRILDRRISRFSLSGDKLVNVADAQQELPILDLIGETVHAVAGIGNPEKFFRHLEHFGLTVIRHPLADHAQIAQADIRFEDGLKVIVTEKDAVKCRGIAHESLWTLPVTVEFGKDEKMQWLKLLTTKIDGGQSGQSQ